MELLKLVNDLFPSIEIGSTLLVLIQIEPAPGRELFAFASRSLLVPHGFPDLLLERLQGDGWHPKDQLEEFGTRVWVHIWADSSIDSTEQLFVLGFIVAFFEDFLPLVDLGLESSLLRLLRPLGKLCCCAIVFALAVLTIKIEK